MMKKIVFLVMALAISNLVVAQGKSFKIGVKLSPSLNFMKTDVGDIATNGRPLRFGYGLIFDRMFSENYALGFGLNMVEFGGHAEYTRTNTAEVMDDAISDKPFNISKLQSVKRDYYKMKYVEIPLTLKLRTATIGKLIYWGQFGAGLGYLFSAYANEKVKDEYSTIGLSTVYNPVTGLETSDDKLDIKSEMNPLRASMIIAAGGEYLISGSTYFTFGLGYNGGLLSIYKNKDQVVKYKDGLPMFSADSKSVTTVDKKLLMSQVQLHIGIIF